MKITSHNYYEAVQKIGLQNLSPALKKGHELIERATKQGSDWKAYQTFQKPMDLQFQALEILLSNKSNSANKKETEQHSTQETKQRPSKTKHHSEQQKSTPKTKKTYSIEKHAGKGVELISPEVVFIKRYASLHHKTKSKEQILSFIRSLQRAIIEKRIRKNSKHAALIEEIQRRLMSVYNKMGKDITLKFETKNLERYLKIGGAEVVMNSVRFIKAYIAIQGKEMTKLKAKALHNRIVDAIEKNKLSEQDKYFNHIKIILKSLADYVNHSSTKPTLSITQAQLNGLEGVLNECACKTSALNGFDDDKEYQDNATPSFDNTTPRNTVLNSQQVIDLKSHKLNFTGKWLNFIGNPSKGFTTMIYGKPKFGKSYLAIDFAGYLARNHGKVLYIAYEEGFDDTLKQKLQDKNVAHPNLFVSDYLPSNLKTYDYVFIDSVNKANLSPEDLDSLERKNSGISFVYIFQTTKDGNFKGAMEYKHNVDVVIEVPERGIATQYGRYNQGGEMSIFN